MTVAKADQLSDIRSDVELHAGAVADLRALADAPEEGATLRGCPRVYVSRFELVPVLAYPLDRSPRTIVPGQPESPQPGAHVVPDERLVEANVYELGLSAALRAPVGSTEVARNASWSVHRLGCGRARS